MKNNGNDNHTKNAPERTENQDPPDTPTEPAAIETRPGFAPSGGIRTEIAPIAPAYEFNLITIRDCNGTESRWIRPFGQPITPEDLEAYIILHFQMADGLYWRN